MKSKVSIIMPVLNGEKYISEALDSLLAQTYRNYELVAVDDGSTDRTREILESYRDRMEIRYVHHPVCKGIAFSVNDGIRNSTGDYITFLDHDDLFFPHMLATQVAYMDSHPDTGMAHSDFQTIDPDGKVVEPSVAFCRDRVRPSGWVFRDLFMDSFIAASTVLIRKSVLDHLGGFDETLYWGDYHLWMRIARHYKIDYTPEVLTKYRQHGGQSTRNLKTDRPDAESVAMLAIKSILELYPEVRKELGETVIRRRMAMLYFDMAYSWLWSGAPANARACLRRAIGLWPSNLTFYSAYLISFLPIQTARALRSAWRRLRAAFSPHGYRPDQYEART